MMMCESRIAGVSRIALTRAITPIRPRGTARTAVTVLPTEGQGEEHNSTFGLMSETRALRAAIRHLV